MKIKFLTVSVLIFCAIVFFSFKIREDLFDLLLKKMDAFSTDNPQEKVHLHLDKPYYTVGDNIWFKAYVLNTKTQAPSDLSKFLYVELINDKDSLTKQLKLPLSEGITWGDFKLPDSLKEGNYRLRAYTQYMRNIGPDFFFDKTLKIGNGWSNKVTTQTQYQFVKSGDDNKVMAKIHFENNQGQPYPDKNLSYEIKFSGKTLEKGKAKTSANGDADINFSSNSSLNAQPGFIYVTLLLNNDEKVFKTIPITATSNAVDVQFFPEGGTLVAGLPQKIAVKVVQSNGNGAQVSGKITDQNGAEITAFSTNKLGMGAFVITQPIDQSYFAQVKFKDGSEQKFNLPTAQKSGYILALNNADSTKVNLKIIASTDKINGSELKVVAQQAGNIYYVSKAKVDKQVVQANVLKKNLPNGIVQFTLFSADNLPIAERLVFVKNNSYTMQLSLNTAQVSTQLRGKVALSFLAKNQNNPVMGSFSVAVTNTSKVQPDEQNESNIFTSMLLRFDLVGYIEKPNDYFLNNNDSTRSALDYLMLTQGYRRYTWQKIINDKAPALNNFPIEKSLSIKGTVTRGGKPVDGGKIMLLSTQGGIFVLDTVTNAEGRFSFDNLIFGDSTKFVVQARTKKDRKFVDIKLDIVPGQTITKNANTGDIEINVNNTLLNYIKQSDGYFKEMQRLGLLQRTIKLNDVVITEKKNPAKNSSNLNGAGRADFILTAEDLNTCTMLSQCLIGRLPGVMQRGNSLYLMRSLNNPIRIIVDGMPVESDFLENIMVADVQTIELLKSISNTALYGGQGAGGILIITTKRGDEVNYYNRYAPGVLTINPKGISQSRVFYSPKYETKSNNTPPDLRSTVFWAPQLVSDSNGLANFEYYNSDEPGQYRVVIEGVDMMGNLARQVYTYQVK